MVKVLCIHGVGHQEANLNWEDDWKTAITHGITDAHPDAKIDVDFYFSKYDDLFAPVLAHLSPADVLRAVARLGGGLFQRPRALADLPDQMLWTAGMVVAWAENDDLRDQTWKQFLNDVQEFEPNLVCRHSLGSLISYDGFRRQEELIAGLTYITFGCQLGNPFVRGVFGGVIKPFGGAAFWHHLYNPHDHVFTAPLDFDAFRTASNFQQVLTDFGTGWPWVLNHDAVNPGAPDHAYLTHPQTRALVWPRIAVPRATAPVTRVLKVAARAVKDVPDAPTHRALLVGINAYPDPANRLEGCVNDVFLMSSVLQECGFDAEDIRVVIDERATASAIMDRLHWLLDGTAANDQRFFYYSGHGAQLPVYGAAGKVERVDACLVPSDFAWSRETAITDDRILNLYSQLPYDAYFMMVLDSCYSGGMTRGGGTRVRGLTPPDDIRHRMLRWDAADQLWVPRDLSATNPNLTAADDEETEARPYVPGGTGMHLLGRAVSLRVLPPEKAEKVRKELKHKGPYLPVVYEACGPQEYSYEYQHGVIAQGAFTYAMATILRRYTAKGQIPTFNKLLSETSQTLQEVLHYDQHPVLVGHQAWLNRCIPWRIPKPRKGKK